MRPPDLALPSASALARLLLAHPVCGIGIALLIRSGLGAAPWDVFHQGVHRAGGISLGVASIVTAAGAVLLARFAGVRPGLGTAINVVLIGICLDLALAPLPVAPTLEIAAGYLAAGILLFGLGTGLYLSAALGAGPRDSLMLALGRVTGWPPGLARATLEAAALTAGLLLGGRMGIGTLVYTFAIGPVVQWSMTRIPAPAEAP